MPAPIIFLHLQKTGGTSVRDVMNQAYGVKNITGHNGIDANGQFRRLTDKEQNARAWHAHMKFGLHEMIDRDVFYFTVLRDPLQREISRWRHGPGPNQRECGRDPIRTHQPDWSMVYLLSGASNQLLPDGLTADHVDQALYNLHKHFLYVGDTSRLGDLVEWVRNSLGWNVAKLPHLNKANPEAYVTDDEKDTLRRLPLVELDRLLYDRVSELGPYPQSWKL